MNAAPPMLVSIITPVYNGTKFLEELIESVKDQDYPQIEHIVVDDGSDDGGATLAILKKHPHLRWWSRENRGQYATMNEGLAAAHGDLICFISADDLCTPGAVRAAVDYMLAHPDADGVYGRAHRVSENGEAHPVQLPIRELPLKWYRYFTHVAHCSLYLRKASVERLDLLFDPGLRYHGDYDWILRMIDAGTRLGFVDRELSKVRVHPGQASVRLKEVIWAERKKVFQRHKVNRLSYGAVIALLTLYSAGLLLMHAFRTAGPKGAAVMVERWVSRRLGRARQT